MPEDEEALEVLERLDRLLLRVGLDEIDRPRRRPPCGSDVRFGNNDATGDLTLDLRWVGTKRHPTRPARVGAPHRDAGFVVGPGRRQQTRRAGPAVRRPRSRPEGAGGRRGRTRHCGAQLQRPGAEVVGQTRSSLGGAGSPNFGREREDPSQHRGRRPVAGLEIVGRQGRLLVFDELTRARGYGSSGNHWLTTKSLDADRHQREPAVGSLLSLHELRHAAEVAAGIATTDLASPLDQDDAELGRRPPAGRGSSAGSGARTRAGAGAASGTTRLPAGTSGSSTSPAAIVSLARVSGSTERAKGFADRSRGARRARSAR